MALLVEAGSEYVGPRTLSDGFGLRGIGVFIDSLPPLGRNGNMECYHPSLRQVKGVRGYVINVNGSVEKRGVTLTWIPKHLGLSAPSLFVSTEFLTENVLKILVKQKEDELVLRLRAPTQAPNPTLTRPWY